MPAFEKKKIFFLVKKSWKMVCNSNNFQDQENPTYFCSLLSLTDIFKISNQSDKTFLSCTLSQVEKCSFEKNAFKILKFA